jgi:glycosyltransferase involved in cell wall biosynthesis
MPQVLDAFAALLPYAPDARLILAGAPAAHYDLAAAVAARGLQSQTVLTGYLETDDRFTEYIAACDVTVNLRWPTAREVSGPWLRCLAAGKPTIVIDLAHIDVPSLDPRTWTVNASAQSSSSPESRVPSPEPRVPSPVCVAVDILDEDHSLRIAMRRLAHDVDLRASLGRAAAEWWQREHTPERMADDYRRLIPLAIGRPIPRPELPPHLVDDGDRRLRALLGPFGMGNPLEPRR